MYSYLELFTGVFVALISRRFKNAWRKAQYGRGKSAGRLNSMKKTFALSVAVVALSAISIARTATMDIVDTAVANGHFKTLVSLVKKEDLVDTLKGTGPFTVLAPTDAAFASGMKKMPSAFKMITSNDALLKKVLLYHVIAGSVHASDLKNGEKVKTVEGEMLTVHIRHGKVMFNNATVVIANVDATNGVIHAINGVLVPPSVLKMLRKHY